AVLRCAMLPPEIQLAQRLAGNEQATRDRALRKLRKYFVARSQRVVGFTHDELLKVWKGLFYCVWMQDKPLLQEELGRNVSELVHLFQTTDARHLFLRTFWQTMGREWLGIDRLRLDKFYMLMRMILSESLKSLKTRGWEESEVEQLLELMTTEILHPDSQTPNGVKSHFLEIFLEELTKVGAAELTAEQNLKFIDPFCKIAARTKDSLVLHHIVRGIFETIVEQAPFAIEDLMNELEAQEGEDKASDSDECSEGERERYAGDEGDSPGPVLQFDYEAVANRLFEVASRQSTPAQNRKRLYKVIRKLQDLAGGTFPEDEVPEKAYRSLLAGRRVRKGKRRLLRRLSQSQRGKGQEEEEEEEEALSPELSSRRKKKSKRRPPRAGPGAQAEASGQRRGSRRGRKPRQPPGPRGHHAVLSTVPNAPGKGDGAARNRGQRRGRVERSPWCLSFGGTATVES
ncbi:ribosomal RNA processing protein 1 homolog A, partial [Ctenodactylus gundi]